MLDRRRPLDEALHAHHGLHRLEGRDRALARLLVATVLRYRPVLDALIDPCLNRPLADKAARARHALRLGAAQLLLLEQPAHAAVTTAVESAPAPFKALANAVLRRLAREGGEKLAAIDRVRTAIPDTLWQGWTAAFGEEGARKVAAASLAEAPLDLSVKADATGWALRLSGRLLPTGSLRLDKAGAVAELPGYAEGAWWVQDAAAALPVRLLGNVAGKTVADLCAAPGGKTAQLAAKGARVIAVDRSDARLDRLRINLARLGLSTERVTADVAAWRPEEPVDAVLLDAPCSATGTIRRHPDILARRAGLDRAKLAQTQRQMLVATAQMVKPGGLVVYAVCSLEPEEGSAVVRQILAEGAPFEPVPIATEEIPGLPQAITPDGFLATRPDYWAEWGGMDGFFAARLRRR